MAAEPSRAFPHGGIIPIRKEKSSRFEILSLGLGDLLGDDASLWQDPLVPCWAGERRAATHHWRENDIACDRATGGQGLAMHIHAYIHVHLSFFSISIIPP